MTEYFEILARDGAARRGILRLADPTITPALADGLIVDAGSEWTEDRQIPDPSTDAITILPHRSFPSGTPDAIVEAFAVDVPDFGGPSGAVIDPRLAGDLGTDMYVVSTAGAAIGNPRSLCDTIIGIREAIPPDAALYVPGVATPANVALLAYAGVDLFDTDRARVAGSSGQYLTSDGATARADLEELPCSCRVCERHRTNGEKLNCGAHNVNALRAELRCVRERIRRGTLRDYVSAGCRYTPWQTAAFRILDQQECYLERRTPVYRRATFLATTDDDLHRPEVLRFADRIRARYRMRFRNPLVLLPCSATKPYAESRSHRRFRGAISYRAHRVTISSPLGVVPQELECTYPAQQYDVPVTGQWSPSEMEAIGARLTSYLSRNPYPSVIAHVAPGPYRELVEAAVAATDIDVTYTVEDHPTTEVSVTALEDALTGELKYSRRDRRHNTVRAIADYQFGEAAGDSLFNAVTVESPYPKHRVLDEDGDLLATMVPGYGLLALTIAGARHWEASDVPTRRVVIDDFVPHGDVLAPGIRDADDEIRVGDEVIVEGPSAYAVGRARMHGRALRESTRGVAVDVRHTEEI